LRRMGEKGRLAMARRLRAETTMSLKRIAGGRTWAVGHTSPTCCIKMEEIEFVSTVRTPEFV